MDSNIDKISQIASSENSIAKFSSLISRVYFWMTVALLITALSSLYTVSSPSMMSMVYGSSYAIWVIFGLELLIVFVISGTVRRLSMPALITLFILFSILNGMTCSFIFLTFTKGSLVSTFLITASTFAVMSIYGYFTKQDLTSWGNILFMGLIGVVIASVVNMFMHSSALYWIVTIVGVFVFVGLVAWDTQKIKNLSQTASQDETKRLAILGAVTLYLDFINLFLLLLNIFGVRRQ